MFHLLSYQLVQVHPYNMFIEFAVVRNLMAARFITARFITARFIPSTLKYVAILGFFETMMILPTDTLRTSPN